jgi:hypothetical protein
MISGFARVMFVRVFAGMHMFYFKMEEYNMVFTVLRTPNSGRFLEDGTTHVR